MIICKGLITLCFVSLAFWIFQVFTCVFYTNILVSKNASENARKTQENLSILHYALGKNASLFLAFLLAFSLTNLTKTTPTHSVIWVLMCRRVYIYI